jgi:hypothetical protein
MVFDWSSADDSYDTITGLSINLVKVNCDGPSLRLSVGFSASSSMDNSLLYQSDVFENQSKEQLTWS